MTTTGKRRRYPTSDSDDDNGEILNSNPQLTNKRRVSAAADFAAHRSIVSERQQLAVLKQLTATDETSLNKAGSPLSSSLIIPQQHHPTKIFRRNEHGEIIVHIAARKGDLKQLKKALKDGANVNEEDNAGWTPLHEAVTKNQFKAARLLLKSGANSNASGPEGQTPLIDAVLNNNTKIVELLLNYSADPSVIDLTRLNETMIKVLKQEITTFDLSDDESISPSSPIISDDGSEQDEKNLFESSSTYISKIQQKKSFHHFREHSSDSLINNDLSRKNPYDFESDDDDDDNETIKDSRLQTNNFLLNDSNDFQMEEHSTSDNEHIYRVPPLRIVLARSVFQNNDSIISSNMDDNSTTESSSLPIIEQNEKFLSTIITSTELNNKVMTHEQEREKNDKKQEENIMHPSDDQIQSPQMIISSIINNILIQIESNENLPLNLSEESNVIKKEKQGDSKQTTRTLRSHAKGKINLSITNQNLNNNNRRVSNRKRTLEKKLPFDINEKPQRKKRISERSNNNETSSNSDDQTIENLQTSIIDRITTNEDTNIGGGGGGGDDDSNSAINIKQIHTHPDIDSLPPNKRRLRERNAALLSSTDTSNTTEEEGCWEIT